MDDILKNRKTGWFKARIVSINPSKQELMDILGECEMDDLDDYFYAKRNGTRIAHIDIYLSDSSDEIFKHRIYLEDSERVSKNSGAKLYVNQIGETQWADSETNLWDNFKKFTSIVDWKNIDGSISKSYKYGAKPNEIKEYGTKQYHVSKIGESDLIHFLRMSDNSADVKDSATNFFIDIDQIFYGNNSEIIDSLPFNTPVFSAFAYVDNLNNQRVFKEFVPLNMFSEMYNNISSKYTQKPFKAWHDSFNYIKDDCKYNFGKLQTFKEEFLPKPKHVDENSSDY